jgi:serine/threonine-protein kinase
MATRGRPVDPVDPAAPTELIGPPSEPPPDRELWPWLLVLLILVVAALAAVWYATRDTGGASGQPVTVQTTVAAGPKPKPVQQQTTTAPTTTAQPQTVVVPDLVGQTRDDAISTLEAQGLTPDARDVPSAQADGIVVSQHPAGGTTVQAQAGVLINVGHKVEPQPRPAKNDANSQADGHSQTPAVTTIPTVVGEDKDSAKVDVRNAGFHVHTERRDTADPDQDAAVIDQSPPGGTSAQAGSDVTIIVGRYRDNSDDATG